MRADDGERILDAFRALDPQSVYQRFFHPKKALTDRELQSITRHNIDRKLVLVATTCSGGRERLVGLGQYIRSSDASAHVAFVVAEDHQGRGIARRMLRRLAEAARARGISQFEADVFADNVAMLKVLRRAGWPIRESEEDGVVHLTLLLPARACSAAMKKVLGTIALLAALVPAAHAGDPVALAEAKQCFSCHALDREMGAPSFRLLAQNYGRIPNANYVLERIVRSGGLGHWGAEPMPAAGPRPEVSEAEAKTLVAWILSMK